MSPDVSGGPGVGTAALASETQGPGAGAPSTGDVGPVAYRVVRREALRFRLPLAGPADDAGSAPDLGAAGRWRAVARGPAADALDAAADAALLSDLEAADGPRGPTHGPRRLAPSAHAAADRGPEPPSATSWWLVATWEAATVVNLGTDAAPIPRVARARRVVAAPLPPPDLARTPPIAHPPWPAAWCAPPPPHPDPPGGWGRDRSPPSGRPLGRARRGGGPDTVAPDPIATGASVPDAFARGVARARAGDPVGALVWFARAEDGAAAGLAGPGVPAFETVRRRLWAAEVRLALGRAAEAADDLAAAAAVVRGTTAVPMDAARAAVATYLAERAEVAAWRADAARRVAGLASAGLGVPRPDRPRSGGPRRAPATRAGPARDARGDATLAWPPVDGADADDDGAEASALAGARRRTAAWWRARRR